MSTENETTEQPSKPTLGVQDLVLIAQIFQLATSRGAWKSEELSTIGGAYDKLIAFLEAAGAVSRNDGNDGNDGTAPSDESSAVALGE
jgi:hypothetical protein